MAKQYRARDRTVQRMGRDGLEEVNLHTLESRRISKKAAGNGRLGKKAGDGDVLLNGGLRTGKRRRRSRRNRRSGNGLAGNGSARADREIGSGGSEDFPQGLAPQAAHRLIPHRSARNDRVEIRTAQDGKKGRSTQDDKKRFRSGTDGRKALKGGRKKRLQRDRHRKDKLIRFEDAAAGMDDAGSGSADGEAGGSGGAQTDEIVQEMHGHLENAGRNLSCQLHHGWEKVRPHFSSKLRSGALADTVPAGEMERNHRWADTDPAKMALNRRAASQTDTSRVLRDRQEKQASGNFRSRAVLAKTEAGGPKQERAVLNNRAALAGTEADGLKRERAVLGNARTEVSLAGMEADARERKGEIPVHGRSKADPAEEEEGGWKRKRPRLSNDRTRTMPARTEADMRKQKNRRMQKAIQKRKYRKAYLDAVRNGVPAAGVMDRLKSAAGLRGNVFSEIDRGRQKGMPAVGIARNKAAAAAAIVLSCVVLLLSLLGFAGLVFGGGLMAVAATTYQSTDEEIHSVEDAYLALENILDRQINEMESTHPGYDEYRYQVDEIAHNPFQLISYLTVVYGEFTLADVEDALRELFDGQYTLLVWEDVETRTRTVADPDTGEETEEEYDYYILNISLTNRGFDTVVRERMTEDQTKLYEAYNTTFGNRQYLFDETTIPDSGATGGGTGYDIPSEALSDERFARMINEAEKYLGYPYVWGGSSPSTSFDCSGFVSWVINNSGNGWSVGRQTANGLRGLCTYVSPEDARPGDLIFFQGTYNTAGASHVGIYVGNGMMIHCGNPIQYASISTAYWQQHFLAFGRLP